MSQRDSQKRQSEEKPKSLPIELIILLTIITVGVFTLISKLAGII